MVQINTNSVPPKIIRDTRESLGYTQVKSAKILGYSKNAWRAWECGRNKMKVDLFNEFLKKTQQNEFKPGEKASMTPEETILKQVRSPVKQIVITPAQKQSMEDNKKIFLEAFEELSAILNDYNKEAKEKIARKLFGKNGTMRTRLDAEANGKRAAIKKHVREW